MGYWDTVAHRPIGSLSPRSTQTFTGWIGLASGNSARFVGNIDARIPDQAFVTDQGKIHQRCLQNRDSSDWGALRFVDNRFGFVGAKPLLSDSPRLSMGSLSDLLPVNTHGGETAAPIASVSVRSGLRCLLAGYFVSH